jgi:hypothetical protein
MMSRPLGKLIAALIPVFIAFAASGCIAGGLRSTLPLGVLPSDERRSSSAPPKAFTAPNT